MMASRQGRSEVAKRERSSSYDERDVKFKGKGRTPRHESHSSYGSRQPRSSGSRSKHYRYSLTDERSNSKDNHRTASTRNRDGSPRRERLQDRSYRSNKDGVVTNRASNKDSRYRMNDERSPIDRSRKSAEAEVDKMLSTEHHHTRRIEYYSSGEIDKVVWCPQYLRPDLKGHIRGGTSLLHHRCRSCRRLCFHLLGQPGTKRLCLECSGLKSRHVPDWYYHKRCKYCLD